MLELYQLEQLKAFADYGTLSEAAEQLHISQPTLTRTMKKLEEEFGVTLFNRTKNKMELNENGHLALHHAEKILEASRDMLSLVRAQDRARRTIAIGSCAPMPLDSLSSACTRAFPEMAVSTEMKDMEALEKGLLDDIYQLVILPYQPENKELYPVLYGHENLSFALPHRHRLSDAPELSFADMNGENMIVFSQIGFWHEMITREMPNSRFLMQNDRFDFMELIQSSILPYFITDRATTPANEPTDRTVIPISDDCAHATFYLVCKKKDRGRFQSILQTHMD